MKLFRSIVTVLICFILLGISTAVAEQTDESSYSLFGEDPGSLFSGDSFGSFDFASLFSKEVITGIITFILAFFMSLFGISLS